MRLLHRGNTGAGGFTLLELLVAVAIFAMLGVGSYRLLATTIASRDASRTHDTALIRLQKGMTVLQRDLSQAIARPVRNDYGDLEAALKLGNNALEFSRQGWPNPLLASRSELQRVRYEVNAKGELWRIVWSQLDRERGMEPSRSLLLEQVEGLQIRALGRVGSGDTDWPQQRDVSGSQEQNDKLALLPNGIEMIMTVKPWGEIRRIYRMPDAIENSQNAPAP